MNYITKQTFHATASVPCCHSLILFIHSSLNCVEGLKKYCAAFVPQDEEVVRRRKTLFLISIVNSFSPPSLLSFLCCAFRGFFIWKFSAQEGEMKKNKWMDGWMMNTKQFASFFAEEFFFPLFSTFSYHIHYLPNCLCILWEYKKKRKKFYERCVIADIDSALKRKIA
jgi:hypothetical protein